MKFRRKNGIVKPLPRCKSCHSFIESQSQLKNLDEDNPLCAECNVKRGIKQSEIEKAKKEQKKAEDRAERDRVQEIVGRGQDADDVETVDEVDTEHRSSFNL